MIIEQEIKVRDRRTLEMVKAHAREQRDTRFESVARSTGAFRAKWTPEHLTNFIGLQVIPHAIAERLTSMALGSKSEESEEEYEEESTPMWKTLVAEFLEGFVPRLVERLVK